MENDSYEEFKESVKKVYDGFFKNISKEQYEKAMKNAKKATILEEKIDKLAKEYYEISHKDKCSEENKVLRYGYYEIIRYCLNQIKNKDEDLRNDFCAEIKE